MALFSYPAFRDFRNPFFELARMKREMDRLFSDFTTARSTGITGFTSGVFPAVNVREEGDAFSVLAELPGVRAEDLDIRVEGNTLVLRGERKADAPEGVSYHRKERLGGRFSKSLSLPYDIQADGVEAEYKDGVLRLKLPKAEHAKPKAITVKAA